MLNTNYTVACIGLELMLNTNYTVTCIGLELMLNINYTVTCIGLELMFTFYLPLLQSGPSQPTRHVHSYELPFILQTEFSGQGFDRQGSITL